METFNYRDIMSRPTRIIISEEEVKIWMCEKYYGESHDSIIQAQNVVDFIDTLSHHLSCDAIMKHLDRLSVIRDNQLKMVNYYAQRSFVFSSYNGYTNTYSEAYDYNLYLTGKWCGYYEHSGDNVNWCDDHQYCEKHRKQRAMVRLYMLKGLIKDHEYISDEDLQCIADKGLKRCISHDSYCESKRIKLSHGNTSPLNLMAP